MDISEYTNYPELYTELGLEKYNCALWHRNLPNIDPLYTTNVIEIIKTKKSWHTADKIFIVSHVLNYDKLVNVDPRIHLWHPILGSTHDRLHKNMFNLQWVTYTAKDAGIVEKLISPLDHNPKYYFDALLGYRKPHRDVIYNGVQNNDLQQKVLLSYFGINEQWLPGHEYDITTTSTGSNFPITYAGQPGAIAAVYLPWKIYNQSWFSIVAETSINLNAISEKTAKPLLGKRLFVFFGVKGALKSLRDIGFKTFDSVIDESYDLEPDNQKRWALAFEQVKYICEQDPAEIYQKILPALEHNQQLMLDTNWFELMKAEMLAMAKQ